MALLDGGGFSRRSFSGPAGSGIGLNTPTGAAGSVVAPYTAPRPRARTSSGPSGRYSSSSAPAPPPAAAPGPIDPNAWLGTDTTYQDALRQLQLALTNFGADVTRRQGMVGQDYTTNERAMQGQRVQDLEALEDDFSGRGIIRSGLYGKAVGDYQEEFGKRLAELGLSKDRALAQLTQEQNAFTTQQELDKQAAREAALRRRASTLGVV